MFFTSKSIYYKRDDEYYFHIHYHKNGNISSIAEGFIDELAGGSTHLQGTNIHFFENSFGKRGYQPVWIDIIK